MDLTQKKLSRTEWNSIEIPVSSREKEILKLILQGYDNLQIEYCTCKTIQQLLKTEQTSEMDYHLFQLFLEQEVKKDIKKHGIDFTVKPCKTKIKKKDQIRVDNFKSHIDTNAYEFLLQKLIHGILSNTKPLKSITG